jgi:hypothetical protein
MELVSLNRSALLVPTPGQTEQEYLAEYLSSKGFFSYYSQKKFNGIPSLNPGIKTWPEELNEQSNTLLDKALNELLE